jgi:hypothetical protein
MESAMPLVLGAAAGADAAGVAVDEALAVDPLGLG